MSNEEQTLIVVQTQLADVEKKVQSLFKKKTPKEVVKLRKGAGGKMFPYVPIDYIVSELDKTFGIFWEFLIDDVRTTETQIIVRGKLVIKSLSGFTISRPGIGRANIKFYQGTKNSVDEGNDEKAATSDAIKKAASLFGIAADVYYKELDNYESLDKEISQTEELRQKAMARFFAVTSERGFPSEKAKDRIKEIYKVAHMEDLNAAQIERTTSKIETMYEPVGVGQKPRKVGEVEDVIPTPIEEPQEATVIEDTEEIPTIDIACRSCGKIVPFGNDPEYFCNKECQEKYFDSGSKPEAKRKMEEFIKTGRLSP